MGKKDFIAVRTICSQYKIESAFVTALNEFGLIHLEMMEHNSYLHQDQLRALEKMIRLHNELHLNMEGIDVVFHLLQKEEILRNEVRELKNRLRLYEDDL